ncbi:MAG: lipoate--protein ligase [Bacteroidales bacterium]|nr:lipoate--protein ligase [Bacteroidales bacterium]
MKFLTNASTDPHFNMAFDEFCLERLQADEPVFYLWQNRPSVIIGLNQSAYAEVNLQYLEDNGIALARRVTGGGAVYHDLQNLNYTITGRIRDLEKDFPAYVETMVRALRALGVPAELSGRNDILVEGRKCSGYAKRLSKDRLMIHGTLMYDVDIDTLTKALAVPGSKLSAAGVASVRSRVANLKDYLPRFSDIAGFQKALQHILAEADGEIVLSTDQLAAIEADADAKFRTWEWIYGHSPAAQFSVSRKYPCGTVEARFSLRAGCIDGLRFSGDFLGNIPASRLETVLQGCRFIRSDLQAALQNEPVSDCFDNLAAGDLASLLLEA